MTRRDILAAVLLAVCIPTHDGRAEQLRRVLDSIAPEVIADERVEVCVSDNASADHTARIVEEFSERIGGRLRYRRFEENRGFTANLLSVVELAEAQWCWLLGSDDLVAPGGLGEIVGLVERHPDTAGATFNRSLVELRDPSIVHHDPPRLLPESPGEERELRGEDSILGQLGQLHDYISTQVVDRELWLRAVADAGPVGLAEGRSYPHLVIIAMMVRRRPLWTWYPVELVGQRVGVSSVYDDRQDFDVSTYEVKLLEDRAAVWSYLFGRRSAIHRSLLRKVWWRHFGPGILLNQKLSPGFVASSDLRYLRVLPRHFWWLPAFWAISFPALLIPGSAMRGIRPWLRWAKERLAERSG